MIDENELEDSLRVCREIEAFRITDDQAMQNKLNNTDLFHNKTLWEVDKVLNEFEEEKQMPEPEPAVEQMEMPQSQPMPEPAPQPVMEPQPQQEVEPEAQSAPQWMVESIPVAKPEQENESAVFQDDMPTMGEKKKKKKEKKKKTALVSKEEPASKPAPPKKTDKKAEKKPTSKKTAKKKKGDDEPANDKPVQKIAVAQPINAYADSSELQEEYIERHPFLRTLLSILVCIVIALILSLVITKFVAYHTSVEGSSMEPTFNNGDQLIVEKFTYYFNEPERYDIIVFPFSENTSYIKRIIGLPGEIIQIKNGQVYLNGEILDENYGKEDSIEDPGLADEEIVLAEDEYFVLGDNRNASVDSRKEEVGLIKRSQIEGKAWVRFYPFDSISTVQ